MSVRSQATGVQPTLTLANAGEPLANAGELLAMVCEKFRYIDNLPEELQGAHFGFDPKKHNSIRFKSPSTASPHIGVGLVVENQHLLNHFCFLYGIPSINWVYDQKVSREGWFLIQLLLILKKE